jgi:hypothetical protein
MSGNKLRFTWIERGVRVGHHKSGVTCQMSAQSITQLGGGLGRAFEIISKFLVICPPNCSPWSGT